MRPKFSSPRVLLVFSMTTMVGVLATAQALQRSASLIVTADEGDVIGSHYIKADPQTGSRRLGVGLQRVTNGQGIPMHTHEHEDEVLFVHSGSGVGAVGEERRNISAGTTLYIPQGTWHGVESRSDMQILWVVSPPHFAANLREIAAKAPSGGTASSSEAEAIARKHGIRDTREFFLPRLTTLAALVGFGAAFVALSSRLRPFRATSLYALGSVLAASLTIAAFGPGALPPIVFVINAIMIGVAVLAGAAGGFGVRILADRVFRRSGT